MIWAKPDLVVLKNDKSNFVIIFYGLSHAPYRVTQELS